MPIAQTVVSANHHDTFVVPVALQQLCAVLEKRWDRYTIVFKKDRFLTVFKDPIDSRFNAGVAAHIEVGVVREYLAVPVHLLNDRSGSFTLHSFSL
jgi:hypothetical protein